MSQFLAQYFVNYNLPRGRHLTSISNYHRQLGGRGQRELVDRGRRLWQGVSHQQATLQRQRWNVCQRSAAKWRAGLDLLNSTGPAAVEVSLLQLKMALRKIVWSP